VERVSLGVWARQSRRPVGVNGTQHVVVGKKVVKAQVFNSSADPAHRTGVASKFGLWVNNAYLHDSSDLVTVITALFLLAGIVFAPGTRTPAP
jgi:hypothetical protein